MSQLPQPFHAKGKDLHGHSNSVTCLAFSPLRDRLASGGEDGNVIIWDPMMGTLLHRVPITSAVTSMAWHPDDTRHCIFVDSANGTIFAINDFAVCCRLTAFDITPHVSHPELGSRTGPGKCYPYGC